ncbi:hypothetical protein [Flavobacterium sp.]
MDSKSINKLIITILKIGVILLAFYFIYNQLTKSDILTWTDFENTITTKFSFGVLVLLFSFSVVNRFLEILKWKNLVSFLVPISTYQATKQVLAALTVGIITPNGIGEYAGKALFFEKSKSKLVVLLNLICNGIQMILTILFGLIGLVILKYYDLALTLSGLGLTVILILFFTKNFKIKNYSINTLLEKINSIPKKIHQKNILLGFLRYLVFSHQYYLLFIVLDVHLPYITLISTIAIVYFLASSLPSFQMFDFAVKGSVALFFFGKYEINEWIILFVSTVMWFLNVVLPVIIGSIFVLNFKSKWK